MNKKIIAVWVLALVMSPVLTAIMETTVEGQQSSSVVVSNVEIEKPEAGFLFILNQKIKHIGKTVVIGPLEIVIKADVEGIDKDKVQFEIWIDGEREGIARWSDSQIRFIGTLNIHNLRLPPLELTVKASDNLGNLLKAPAATLEMTFLNIRILR